MSLLSHGTLDEKAELIFNLYDFDKSMSISKDELTVLMTNVLTALKSMEGKQPLVLPTISEVEMKTSDLFKKFDTDRNNSISLKEFKSYIKKDTQILSILSSFGIAKSEDLGTNFGDDNGTPEVDSDLEEECNPKGLDDRERKEAARAGIS